jgi:hypothetical protein
VALTSAFAASNAARQRPEANAAAGALAEGEPAARDGRSPPRVARHGEAAKIRSESTATRPRGGRTWCEAGGGLPPGFAVAVADDDPDRILYAARNRLYLSANGGIFWRSLEPELPDIVAIAWL